MQRCGECGFDYEVHPTPDIATLILHGVDEFATLLTDPAADVRSRRASAVWSPLEYGCHLRDVLLVQRERVLAARRSSLPSFAPMGRDERVEHDGYADQKPMDVANQLAMAAQLFAGVLDRLGPDDWERRVIYNYPVRCERTLRWVAANTAHEVHHHLLDARRQLG